MTGRELLFSLLDISEEIEQKIDQLDEIRAMAIGITASTDKDAVQSSGSKDRLGNALAKIVDLEKEINELTDGFVERKNIAKKCIFAIDNERYQNVLYDYFILRNPMWKVAEDNELTYDHCKKCHKRAIKRFDKLYNTRKCCD